MLENHVYVGLGANLGDKVSTLTQAVLRLQALPEVAEMRVSHLYRSSPVSSIPQPDFLNAVCGFSCSLGPEKLHEHMQEIEIDLGKVPKKRDEPREIDLDLLFYGARHHQSEGLTVPHPRWSQRLFVLVPLRDLVSHLTLEGGEVQVDLDELIANHEHQNEIVELYQESTHVDRESPSQRFCHWTGGKTDPHQRSMRY